ncbi:MAG: histidine kinase, partial [Microthrixaceae bacterium]
MSLRKYLGSPRVDPATDLSGFDRSAELRAAFQPAITVMRWGSVGFGLVAIAPTRTDSGWTDVALLAVCVFMTTLRTLMPLELDSSRRWQSIVPIIDVAVFSVAVGWTDATESPWVLCLLSAVCIASFGWGSSMALTVGAISVALVSIFLEVAGADLTEVVSETNDLLAVIGLALAAAGGVFMRTRVLQAASGVRRMDTELSRLTKANELLGELSDVALTLPGAFTLREAIERTRSLLATYTEPRVIALLTLDEHNDEWTPKITDRCAMRAAYPKSDLPAAFAEVLASETGSLDIPELDSQRAIGDDSASGVYVVLRARDRDVGVLGLEHPDPHHFDELDPVLRQGLADVIALTIDNSRWFGRLRSLGAEEERIRVARDIHDRLGQWMTYIKLELEGMSAGGDVDRERLEQLSNDASEALDE